MIRHNTCVTVHCDTEKCDNWEDGALHFPDEAEAFAYVLGDDALGWRQWPDGRLLCRGCSEVEDCVQAGSHTYGEWREWQGVQWRSCGLRRRLPGTHRRARGMGGGDSA